MPPNPANQRPRAFPLKLRLPDLRQILRSLFIGATAAFFFCFQPDASFGETPGKNVSSVTSSKTDKFLTVEGTVTSIDVLSGKLFVKVGLIEKEFRVPATAMIVDAGQPSLLAMMFPGTRVRIRYFSGPRKRYIAHKVEILAR